MSDTIVHGVSIDTGEVSLVIPDIQKPMWHGDYHGGKLSIYEATSVPSVLPACISVVVIFTDSVGTDFVMTAHYELDVPVDYICSHIQGQAIIAYAKNKKQPCPIIVMPEPPLPQ